MIQLFHTFHRFKQRVRVQQVAFDEFHVHTVKWRAIFAGHHHYAHVVATLQAQAGYMVANKSGATGNQDFAHVVSFAAGIQRVHKSVNSCEHKPDARYGQCPAR